MRNWRRKFESSLSIFFPVSCSPVGLFIFATGIKKKERARTDEGEMLNYFRLYPTEYFKI